MRIACVHIPQFALQCLTRIDPSLRGAAVAVVGSGTSGARPSLYGPIVQACSRAAWSLGIRIGMTATAANQLAPGELRVVTGDAALERETVRAIADALLAPTYGSGVVDVGGRVGAGGAHLAIYCEVPVKTRGTTYGDRLLELLELLGLTSRIGIADDRFTAWVAAAHGAIASSAPGEETGVISVPRGGSAAFLSPRPLSLLAITPEVQHMLEALGVRTLGEFAALPAPSVGRSRTVALEADYQALARGESGQSLRPYTPEAPVREEVVISTAQSGAAAVAVLAERIALRLAGRGRGAARLEVIVTGAAGVAGEAREVVVPITPLMAPMALLSGPSGGTGRGHVLDEPEELAEAIGRALGDELSTASRLRVAVTGEAISGDAIEAAPAVMQAQTIDALTVVLSSTGSGSSGSGSWRLTAPGADTTTQPATIRNERRDAHRRTRRGKDDRKSGRRVRGAELPVQPWLFAERK